MEIERKFTIKTLPEHLEDYPCHIIEQAYLCTQPVVRIRRQDDTYYMTYKGSGLLCREEYNLPLTKQAYEHLKTKADGIMITKKRYVIPLPHPRFSPSYTPTEEAKSWQPVIELDLFQDNLAPLIMAEIEFPDEATAHAYLKEDWFLEDVTLDPRYHNSHLSQHGLQ